MQHEIATLKDWLAQGGDWRAARDEISELHGKARTEEEYVTLLEAFNALVCVGPEAYTPEVWQKMLPVALAEYKLFLNIEAMEDGNINPVKLERITRREVEAGRLNAEDSMRELAVAGVSMGDSAEHYAHKCKRGDWVFYGGAGAVLISLAMRSVALNPLWAILVALLVGFTLNDIERRRIKREVAERRVDEEQVMQAVMSARA